jgi:apolipoprotein N-acyltransferase
MSSLLNNTYAKYLVLIVAGLISVFAFAPFNYSWIIIISLCLLLTVIEQQKNTTTKDLISYGYVYGLAYFNVQLYWIFYSIYKVIDAGFWVSLVAIVGFTLFLATYFALTLWLYGKIKSKNQVFNLVFLFPSVWVFFEWLRGWLLGGFPWCEIGYSQVANNLFRGFYPLLGNYSVSWLILSLSGIILLLLKHPAGIAGLPKTFSFRLAIIYCTIMVIAGSFLAKVEYTRPYGKPVSIALIQGNIPENVKWKNNDTLDVYARAIAKTKADIIMLPETAISQFEEYLPEGYLAGLANSARANGASLVIGIPKIIDKQYNYENTATVLTAPGRPYYAKYHLVPYGEYIPAKWLLGRLYASVSLPMVGFTAGPEYQAPLVASNQKLAFNICYENGFSTELTQAAANSTIMVNLSDMVWYGTTIAKDEHLQLSQARALENQRYFIQVTNTGLTAIINPSGQIQSLLPVFKRAILKDYVQGRTGHTPFEKYGNYPIISLCLGLIALGVSYSRAKSRVKTG